MKPRTVDETYSILREIDADRRRAEAGMWLSVAKMERREQFWRGVGLVAAGVLIMLGNRERGKS
jgi:hypothetical protein